MKTKLLILIAFSVIGTNGWSQISNNQAAQKNQNPKLANSLSKDDKTSSNLFKIFPGSSEIDVKKDIRNAVFLEIDFAELARINKMKSSLLTLTIPVSENSDAAFDLRDAKLLTDNFSIITDKNEKVNYTPGLYYQGTVSGVTPSLAAWSMFDNSVMAVFSYNNANYVLGLWKDKSNVNNNIYIFYNDNDVLYPRNFTCGTPDVPKNLSNNNGNGGHLQSNQCIKIYFECDYQMFIDKGSVVNVANYVTGLFNVIQTLYNVETLQTEVSQIYVWTASDPYIPFTTSGDLLNNFQATRTIFNGNVAHLLTTRNLGAGGMAFLDVICTPNTAYAISNIDNTFAAYPNTSWTSLVVTHELGHNFGSNHTHWCGWPGGAIDDCYPVEGTCSPGPTPPVLGGTIMSYCHLTSTGILLTNGFGALPGGAIRASYAAASCLTACASPPVAGFIGSPMEYCSAPATVTFTDQTLGYITNWAWDIDNNGTVDYTTQSPTHTYLTTGTYTVKLVATNANGSNTIIKTNYIIIGTVVPSVTIAVTTGSNSLCAGMPVTFTATAVNGGASPIYHWYLNGVTVPGGTFPTYTSSLLSDGDVITCGITSTALCPSPATAISTGITMTITPIVNPAVTVSITSGSATVCAGTSVSFLATPFNGGTAPVYQWQVNGLNVGTNSTTFSSSTLNNVDLVTCILTTNAACANPLSITSGIVPIIVNSIVSPTVSIAITSGTNPTCAGVPITFTASSTSGGTLPVYQWKKNGINTIIGSSYTPTLPANGDVITCTVTSNASCLSTTTGTSPGTTINLIPSPVPSVAAAITSGTNPSCTGSAITFTATPTNATSPAYQWFLNGGPIPGAQSQSYTPSSISNGSVIYCILTSTAACTSTAASTGINVTVVPIAAINFISDVDVCGGSIASNIFSSNPLGANYTWTNSNTSIGLAANGIGDVPSFNGVNSTSSPITATVNVTPSISNCPGTPNSYTITINPTPVITQTGTTLSSSAASTYQWYRNGQLIAAATYQTCSAVQYGDYCVIVNGGGCPSNVITVETAGITQLDNDCFFNVYPNPNDGNFFVSFEVPNRNNYTLKMINLIGELIYKETLTDFDGKYSKQMNFENFGKGVYLMNLTSPEGEIVKKIIIY